MQRWARTSSDCATAPATWTRNNPYAARAVQVLVNNTVGGGVLGQITSRSLARGRRWNQLGGDPGEGPGALRL